MYKQIIFFFALLLALTKPSFSEDRLFINNKLATMVINFNKDAAAKNIDKLVNYIPPHLLSSLGRSLNKTNQQLRTAFKAKLVSQLKNDSSTTYEITQRDLNFSKTKDGQIYKLLNTKTKNNNKIIYDQLLAIYENDRWYVIYGGARSVQNPLFTSIYPSLKEIDFKPARIVRK